MCSFVSSKTQIYEPTTEQWAKFDKIARHVRVLNFHKDTTVITYPKREDGQIYRKVTFHETKPQVMMSIWAHMIDKARGNRFKSPLFPNLHTLSVQWYFEGTMLPRSLFSLAGNKLNTLVIAGLELGEPRNKEDVWHVDKTEVVLLPCSAAFSALQVLNLCKYSTSMDGETLPLKTEMIQKFVVNLSSLRELRLSTSIDRRLLVTLGTLPTLRVLQVQVSEKLVSALSANALPPALFPSLVELAFEAMHDDNSASAFLHTMGRLQDSSLLKTLAVRTTPSASVGGLFATIGLFPRLESISVDVSPLACISPCPKPGEPKLNQPTTPSQRLTRRSSTTLQTTPVSTIRSPTPGQRSGSSVQIMQSPFSLLFGLRNLRHLNFKTTLSIILTDQDLRLIGCAWPRLESLCIWPWCPDNVAHSPAISLDGIADLVDACPGLGILELVYSVTLSLCMDLGRARKRRLAKLTLGSFNLGRFQMMGSATQQQSAARAVRDFFPALREFNVHSSGWQDAVWNWEDIKGLVVIS